MDFADLLGKTITSIVIENNKYTEERDSMHFHTADGMHFVMYHDQDCCESVSIEDVVGELTDLLNSPILQAEESSQKDPDASESGTWTFYKLATINGYVTIRWYGSSNGYYSESVTFHQV